jgi:hypothetical protein
MGRRGRHHTNPRGRRNGDRRHATPSVNTIVANKNGCINDGDESSYSTCGCCASSTAMPRSSPEPGSPFMDAERWRRVEQLFHAAQPLTPRGHHATGARPTVHLLSVARRSWRHLGRGRDRGFVATMSRRRRPSEPIAHDLSMGSHGVCLQFVKQVERNSNRGGLDAPSANVVGRQKVYGKPVIPGRNRWCGRGDSNPHWIAPTSS